MRAASFGNDLFRAVRPGFFRVLAGSNARAYADVLRALEEESTQRNEGISREEALSIVARALEDHPEFEPESDEAANGLEAVAVASLPPREQARRVLDYLARKDVGWVEDVQLPDWQRRIYFDANGTALLAALRRMAYPEAVEFTDPFVGVCATLANTEAFAREPLAHLENCLKGASDGLQQLRAMGKGIERLIRRQIESQTLAETYSVIFDQYAEQVGHECYAALVRARLPARLDAAKDRIGEISCDDALVQAMQAEVIRRENCDPAPAMARVRNHLAELRDKLDFVQPLADEIDRRTAEFTRRSLARSRYLQEVIGERRGQIKDFFEKINGAMQGRRLNDLRELESMPPLLLPSAKLLAGRDSLYEPPHRRSSEENAPVEDAVTDSMRQDALAQLGGAMRNSLTVARANRLAARLPGGKGARIASADLPIETEHDIEDLLALLLHAEASAARYRIETTEEDHSQKDRKLAYQFDRFFVIKK